MFAGMEEEEIGSDSVLSLLTKSLVQSLLFFLSVSWDLEVFLSVAS